jgi:hypothetical protein
MDKPKITAKDFFVWAGAMIALYWTVIAFIFLLFKYIDYVFPDVLSSYMSDPYQSGIGYEMASILVLFPIYLVLMWIIGKSIQRDHSRKDIWIRRWAIILTLFVAGATIAIDLIEVLTKFFNGESLTAAFLLKVVLIFLVAAAAFMHFIADLWGYWDMYPSRQRSVGVGVSVLAIVAIVSGFFIIGTPQQARLYRFDDQKVTDLQNIQSQIVGYWQAKRALPATLTDLSDSIGGFAAPLDPQSQQAYGYNVKGPLAFELCATFNAEAQKYSSAITRFVPMAPGYSGKASSQDNWQHGAGLVCFERTIDPQLYPPLNKNP